MITLKDATIGQPDIDDLKFLSVKISKKVGESDTKLLGSGTILCDGVDFYVLSAAHCFRDKNGNQNCQKEDIILSIFDDNYKQTFLYAKGLELSDEDKDTAIIPIKNPNLGYEYFDRLKLIGHEIDGHNVYVFGFTEKRPTGRLFKYIRVNSHVFSNLDNIQEKGMDFFKTVKGSSGGGVFIGINNKIYCMGFVKSTFDEVSSLSDVVVQPVNAYKNDWGAVYYGTIEEALGRPYTESTDNPLQKECIKKWREVYDLISRGDNLESILSQLNQIHLSFSTPKSINLQDGVMSLLFRRQEPWPVSYQDVFLMALEDKGMWLSIYGNDFPATAGSIADRPLAKKLEIRGETLTRAPYLKKLSLNNSDGNAYYEQILRYAFAFDFTNLKKHVEKWYAKGFWTARKAIFTNLFGENKDTLITLDEYLKDPNEDNLNEKFIATVVYNVVNRDFQDRKSYDLFTKKGLESISNILAHIADQIEKRQEKVSVFGVHQRFIFGGEDNNSAPEALRLIRTIIDAGVLTCFRFTYFISPANWLKVVKQLFTFMPYPMLFYTLMYNDEKLLKRVGQEFAYSNDVDVMRALPDIQSRLLKAIGNQDTPGIFIGLYLVSSELYVALRDDIWYEAFKNNVLYFFCGEAVLQNVSYRDPIFINVKEAVENVRNTEWRIEVFKILTDALSHNSFIVNALIRDHFFVDDELMHNEDFIDLLMNVIKSHPLKETYMIASLFGGNENADERLCHLIDEVAKTNNFDFGGETCKAICMLSEVVKDSETRKQMRERMLKEDMWNCGINEARFTDPRPVGLECVSPLIGWTVKDWERIKANMLENLSLMSQKRPNRPDIIDHFGKEYIDLLSAMRYFTRNIQKVEGCEVEEVMEQIDGLLTELRGYSNVVEAFSSDDYDTVVDGIWYLRDLFKDEGIDACKNEITLLINRVLLQVPTALESCASLLAAFVKYKTKEMTDVFGLQLLEVLKRYKNKFDYEALFVSVPSIYKSLRRIAVGLIESFNEEESVKYWLEDKMVNRFNY